MVKNNKVAVIVFFCLSFFCSISYSCPNTLCGWVPGSGTGDRCGQAGYFSLYKEKIQCIDSGKILYEWEEPHSVCDASHFPDYGCYTAATLTSEWTEESDGKSFKCIPNEGSKGNSLYNYKRTEYYACYEDNVSPPPEGCQNDCGEGYERMEDCNCICVKKPSDECHYIDESCQEQDYIINAYNTHTVTCNEDNQTANIEFIVVERRLKQGEIGDGEISSDNEPKCLNVSGAIELTYEDTGGGDPPIGFNFISSAYATDAGYVHVGDFYLPGQTVITVDKSGKHYSIRCDWEDQNMWWCSQDNFYIECQFGYCSGFSLDSTSFENLKSSMQVKFPFSLFNALIDFFDFENIQPADIVFNLPGIGDITLTYPDIQGVRDLILISFAVLVVGIIIRRVI